MYTDSQSFGKIKIFLCFRKIAFLLIKAVSIWLQLQYDYSKNSKAKKKKNS